MSAPTMVRDLVVAHTRALKLPGVARTFEGLARQARDNHWPHEDYLNDVARVSRADSWLALGVSYTRATQLKERGILCSGAELPARKRSNPSVPKTDTPVTGRPKMYES
jgi:hypothetical protein